MLIAYLALYRSVPAAGVGHRPTSGSEPRRSLLGCWGECCCELGQLSGSVWVAGGEFHEQTQPRRDFAWRQLGRSAYGGIHGMIGVEGLTDCKVEQGGGAVVVLVECGGAKQPDRLEPLAVTFARAFSSA